MEKKDLIDWYQPTRRHGMKLRGKLRVRKSKGSSYLSLGPDLCMKHAGNGTEVQVAFSLRDKTPFLVINPKEGVPVVPFRCSETSKKKGYGTWVHSSVDLVEEFEQIFSLDFEKEPAYDFTVKEWDGQEINGMTLYQIELIEPEKQTILD